MKIYIRAESVTIEGYVNAVERNSKPLNERGVTFIERIAAGAFKRAIARAKDIRILLNHNSNRDLGGLSDGNLELEEDSIGLRARATITDPEVVADAKRGDLVGWSFGFEDVDDGVKQLRDEETGLPLRKVNDLSLYEVSLLNRKKSPAYAGTLVSVRDDGQEEERKVLYAEEYLDKLEIREEHEEKNDEQQDEQAVENRSEDNEQAAEPDKEPEVKEVSSEYYARYKNMIAGWK